VEAVGSLFPQEEVTVSRKSMERSTRYLLMLEIASEAGQPIVGVSTVELKLALDQQRRFIGKRARGLACPRTPMTPD